MPSLLEAGASMKTVSALLPYFKRHNAILQASLSLETMKHNLGLQ